MNSIVVSHIISAIILVNFPSYLLVPLIATLTYQSNWASLLINIGKNQVLKFFEKPENNLSSKIHHKKNYSIHEWVGNHYDTLKRIFEEKHLKNSV